MMNFGLSSNILKFVSAHVIRGLDDHIPQTVMKMHKLNIFEVFLSLPYFNKKILVEHTKNKWSCKKLSLNRLLNEPTFSKIQKCHFPTNFFHYSIFQTSRSQFSSFTSLCQTPGVWTGKVPSFRASNFIMNTRKNFCAKFPRKSSWWMNEDIIPVSGGKYHYSKLVSGQKAQFFSSTSIFKFSEVFFILVKFTGKYPRFKVVHRPQKNQRF